MAKRSTRSTTTATVTTAPENAPANWQDQDGERWREFAVGDANDDPDYDAKMRSLFGHPSDLQRYYAERYLDQARLISPRYDGPSDGGGGGARATGATFADESEPRDYHGRWTRGDGGGGQSEASKAVTTLLRKATGVSAQGHADARVARAVKAEAEARGKLEAATARRVATERARHDAEVMRASTEADARMVHAQALHHAESRGAPNPKVDRAYQREYAETLKIAERFRREVEQHSAALEQHQADEQRARDAHTRAQNELHDALVAQAEARGQLNALPHPERLAERLPTRTLGGDVSGEPRDYHGRWTAGGGGGGEKAGRGAVHGARAKAGKAGKGEKGAAAAKGRKAAGKAGRAKREVEEPRGLAEVKAAKRAFTQAQRVREDAAKTMRDAKAKSDAAHKAFNDALAHRDAVHAQVRAEIRQAALEHAAAHAPVKFGKWQRADAAMAARIAKMPEGRAKQEAEILRKIKQDDVAYNYELKHSYFEDPRSIAAHERVNATGKARVEAANAHEAAAKAHEATEEPLYHAEEAYMVARRQHGIDENGKPVAERTPGIHLDQHAIEHATTVKELENVLRAINPNLKVGLAGADLERARDITREFADLAEEYPHAMSKLKYIGAASDPSMKRELQGHRGGLFDDGNLGDTMYASYNGAKHGIMFEKLVTHDTREGRAKWLRNLRTGWLSADKNDASVRDHVARYITRHEFGHHVDRTLERYAGPTGKHAQKQFLQRMREDHYNGDGISHYGGSLRVERFAEAFAALKYGRAAAKAHPYTQALGRMLHAYMP